MIDHQRYNISMFKQIFPTCTIQMFWFIVLLYIFTSCVSCAVRASQNTNTEYKYTAIPHTKPSNKKFIIQLKLFSLVANKTIRKT